MERLTLNYVWKQKLIPVVLRRTGRGEKLRARLPFADDNRQWLQNGRRLAPEWIGGSQAYWEMPKSWFNNFVDRTLHRYGKVYIIQPYREQEICARACQEAQGHECQCSCMGANHGAGNDGGWFRGVRYVLNPLERAGARVPSAHGPVERLVRRLRHRASDEFFNRAVEKHALDVMPGAFDETARHQR